MGMQPQQPQNPQQQPQQGMWPTVIIRTSPHPVSIPSPQPPPSKPRPPAGGEKLLGQFGAPALQTQCAHFNPMTMTAQHLVSHSVASFLTSFSPFYPTPGSQIGLLAGVIPHSHPPLYIESPSANTMRKKTDTDVLPQQPKAAQDQAAAQQAQQQPHTSAEVDQLLDANYAMICELSRLQATYFPSTIVVPLNILILDTPRKMTSKIQSARSAKLTLQICVQQPTCGRTYTGGAQAHGAHHVQSHGNGRVSAAINSRQPTRSAGYEGCYSAVSCFTQPPSPLPI